MFNLFFKIKKNWSQERKPNNPPPPIKYWVNKNLKYNGFFLWEGCNTAHTGYRIQCVFSYRIPGYRCPLAARDRSIWLPSLSLCLSLVSPCLSRRHSCGRVLSSSESMFLHASCPLLLSLVWWLLRVYFPRRLVFYFQVLVSLNLVHYIRNWVHSKETWHICGFVSAVRELRHLRRYRQESSLSYRQHRSSLVISYYCAYRILFLFFSFPVFSLPVCMTGLEIWQITTRCRR